ncbi:MAG: molybdate ABC transporter substrate-binding protein [Hyphomicrobiaceae bacterium]
MPRLTHRRSRRAALAVVLAGALAAIAPQGAAAQGGRDVKVAVAANFTEPAKEIAAVFAKSTGNKLILSFGATGQFYAQIKQGAPFEVFLAADKATPTKTVAEGLAVAGTQITYAVGKLVLYSTAPGLVAGEETLKSARFAKIAIANPATAPYGAAAVEVMKALGVHDALASKIVQGQSIGQTYQFVRTGNAEVGFVALSQIALVEGGSRWVVPGKLHQPILQDAVLLKAGESNPATREFLRFLAGKEAQAITETFGYGLFN